MDEPVVLLDRRIDSSELARLVRARFEDMVKYVVDVLPYVTGAATF